MRALVLEDDEAVARLNQKLLEQEGFDVDIASTVQDGSRLVLKNSYDLVTLDIHLPDGIGLEVLELIRSRDALAPVLVVSGNDNTAATVDALDAGADDYLNKPYVSSELRARVRALMRRSNSQKPRKRVCGNIVLDSSAREVMIDGTTTSLTPKEFLLLEYFARHVGEEVTRKELLEKVWRFDFDPGTNMVDVNVSRLRAKLINLGGTCRLESVRNVGYVMRVETGVLSPQ